jgi:hypothetical protein
MRELVRSALPREWEIDGQRVLIPPPSVRDALEVLATHEGYRAGDDADTGVFQDALRRWLPAEAASAVLAGERTTTVTLVLGLILEGVDASRAAPERKNGRKMKRPFVHMLGSYCRLFRLDPYQVYTSTPWPFFLTFLQESHRQTAVEGLSNMRTALAPNMKSEAIKKMGSSLESQLEFEGTTDEEREHAEMEASREGIRILEMMKVDQNA